MDEDWLKKILVQSGMSPDDLIEKIQKLKDVIIPVGREWSTETLENDVPRKRANSHHNGVDFPRKNALNQSTSQARIEEGANGVESTHSAKTQVKIETSVLPEYSSTIICCEKMPSQFSVSDDVRVEQITSNLCNEKCNGYSENSSIWGSRQTRKRSTELEREIDCSKKARLEDPSTTECSVTNRKEKTHNEPEIPSVYRKLKIEEQQQRSENSKECQRGEVVVNNERLGGYNLSVGGDYLKTSHSEYETSSSCDTDAKSVSNKTAFSLPRRIPPNILVASKIKEKYIKYHRLKNPAQKCDTEENDLGGDSENIRNQILLQLQLLRSKKSSGFSKNLPYTSILDGHVFPTTSKERYPREYVKHPCVRNGTKENDIASDNNEKTTRICESFNSDEGLGKSDISSQDETSCIDRNSTCEADSSGVVAIHKIKPTKTTDITKIKGWRNKFFLPSPEEKVTPNFNLGEVTSVSSERQEVLEETKNNPRSNTDGTTAAISESHDDNITSSAFCSSNLDGFLNDSANLQISFVIPKLDRGEQNSEEAKEGGISKYIAPSPEPVSNERNLHDLYWTRTVAQRRRIWGLKKNVAVNRDRDVVSKPRTLAEKRKLLHQDNNELTLSKKSFSIKPEDSEKCVDTGNNCLKHSFVSYRGKKLKVPTYTDNDIICHVKGLYSTRDYVYVPRKQSTKSRPSIFRCTRFNQEDAIKYKPGPLCMKANLQEKNVDWKTLVMELPPVYLDVLPEVGKPIHPKLRHLLPIDGEDISESRAKFAASIISKEPVSIAVPYKNQQDKFMLREKVTRDRKMGEVKELEYDNVDDVVKDVIGKMINYVETREIASEIFQREGDGSSTLNKDVYADTEDEKKKNNAVKKRKIKTNYELKRLNVKVIEVNLEEHDEVGKCNKEFCRLGCVCKSLATTSSLISNHCGVSECMFECICNYNKKNKGNLKVTLPIGTDVLSETAVSRLEVEAKRNLAKVEKEFTQTVIRANNQTIIVGGCTNRQRRTSKLPKKYTDFIENPEDMHGNSLHKPFIDNKDESKHQGAEMKNCKVSLTRLNLEKIVPFCLVHNLHQCHCNYESEFICEYASEQMSKEILVSKPPDFDGDCCARTKGIPTNCYLVRNQTEKFKRTRNRKLVKQYHLFVMNSMLDIKDNFDGLNLQYAKQRPDDSDTEVIIVSPPTDYKNNRRKQELKVRNDECLNNESKVSLTEKNSVGKVNIHKKYKKCVTNVTVFGNSISPIKKSDEVVEIEEIPNDSAKTRAVKSKTVTPNVNFTNVQDLIEPSEPIRKHLTLMSGKKGAHFKLVSWTKLVNQHQQNKLDIWYSRNYKPTKIIIADSNTRPKFFYNIKKYIYLEKESSLKDELITWLIKGQLPNDKRNLDIYVVLQNLRLYFEICGICEKQTAQTPENVLLSILPSAVTPSNTLPSEANKNIAVTQNRDKICVAKKILFTKLKCSTQNLESLLEPNGLNEERIQIAVNLPIISQTCLWRMMQLNSNFSVLKLDRNNYAIKYSDLLKISNMSVGSTTTIMLKTPEICKGYLHPDYGIYASPNVTDKIFIGPYYQDETHDITTYRYANRQLMKTELFCRMSGQEPRKTDVWLKLANKEKIHTIDLTECDSENEDTNGAGPLGLSNTAINNQDVESENDMIQDSMPPVLTNVDNVSRLPKPETDNERCIIKRNLSRIETLATEGEFLFNDHVCTLAVNERNLSTYTKKYCISNVPFLGYLALYQKKDNLFLLTWPIYNEPLLFHHLEGVRTWIERELEWTFMNPTDFKIEVNITSELPKTEQKQLSRKFFDGYYVISKYGVQNLMYLTHNVRKMWEIKRFKLYECMKQHSKKIFTNICMKIAEDLFPLEEVTQMKMCTDLVRQIKKEINFQQYQKLILEKSKVRFFKQQESLIKKLEATIKDISPHLNKKSKNTMEDILNRYKMPKKKESEVVCIDLDSDGEDQNISSVSNSGSVGKTCDKVENAEIAPTLSSILSEPQIDSGSIEVKENLRDKMDDVVEKVSIAPNVSLSNQNQTSRQNFKIKIRKDLTYPTSGFVTSDKQGILNKLKIAPFKAAKVKKFLKAVPINATMLSVTQASSTVLTSSATSVTTSTLGTSKAGTSTIATTTSGVNTKHQYIFKTVNGKILTLRSSDIQQLKSANVNLSAVKKPVVKILPKFTNNVSKMTGVNQSRVPTTAANVSFLSPKNKFVKLELCKNDNKNDVQEVLTIKLSKGKDNKSSGTTIAELK